MEAGISRCKKAVQDLLNAIGCPICEDIITNVIMLYHPEFTRRDIHLALIQLESERAVKSVYETRFVSSTIAPPAAPVTVPTVMPETTTCCYKSKQNWG